MLTGFNRLSSNSWPELREVVLANPPFTGHCVELACAVSGLVYSATHRCARQLGLWLIFGDEKSLGFSTCLLQDEGAKSASQDRRGCDYCLD